MVVLLYRLEARVSCASFRGEVVRQCEGSTEGSTPSTTVYNHDPVFSFEKAEFALSRTYAPSQRKTSQELGIPVSYSFYRVLSHSSY